MPRNAQGIYTLPAGNPVVPGTLIETTWANPTMSDIAAALTGSLPRDGSAPMTGDLQLSGATPATGRSAVSKDYVTSFLATATGMPTGSVVAYSGNVAPPGFLECNGQAVSRTTYSDLFGIIGTIYGNGDGSTTFNVPDMRDEFIRGKSDSRAVGNKQTASFAAHTHAINDPGHNHAFSDPGHSHTASQPQHNHGVNDPGHSHSQAAGGAAGTGYAFGVGTLAGNTGVSGTGISIQLGGGEAVTVNSAITGASVASAVTGLTNGAAGGDETRPQNIAQIYIIKAISDAGPISGIIGITSSDTNMIDIGVSNPAIPELVIHSNVAFGIPKLDASGKILLSQLPTGSQQLLGYWDASGGQTPSQASPSTDYNSGDTYIISVTGTLTVYDPVTLTESPTVVAVGSLLQYIENSLTNPTGWYYVVSTSTVVASQVAFTPVGSIAATNVQAALAEVDGDVVANAAAIAALQTDVANKVPQTSATGAATLPSGSDSQRPAAPILGQFRYNNQGNVFEGYTPNGWGQIGGMTQAAAEAAFLQVDGGNQMLAPLVFNSNTNAVVRVGATSVAQLPTTCGIPFCKNKLFNGEVTRINQRGFDGNWTPKGTWNASNTIEQQELCYGYDMWAKASATDMVQPIEAGNFRPATVHTISGNNMTTRQETSPASGNWNIVVPQAARNVQVEEGAVATPFEIRPISFELAQCQRYFQLIYAPGRYANTIMATIGYESVQLMVEMRTVPAVASIVQWQYWSGGADTNFTPTFSPFETGVVVQANGLVDYNGMSGGTASVSAVI